MRSYDMPNAYLTTLPIQFLSSKRTYFTVNLDQDKNNIKALKSELFVERTRQTECLQQLVSKKNKK